MSSFPAPTGYLVDEVVENRPVPAEPAGRG
jgi:hypothetical protein